MDAANYIRELTRKVRELNQELAGSRNVAAQYPMPIVTVETIEEGFFIKIFSENSHPGQLVSVLEVFDDLSLNTHQARVSCIDSFRLEAFSKNESESVDAEMVKQAVERAINKYRGNVTAEN